MAYTPQFEREYENGWVDYPSEETLVTAHALDMYDGTFEHIEDYLEDNPIADANAAITNDYWDAATAYSVGDVVIYLNGLYRCIVANTGQNPTDVSYWEATSLADIAQPQRVALTDFITMNTGFSLVESSVYKQSKHIFGNLVIKSTSVYSSSSVVAGNINADYIPQVGILPVCSVGADEWNSASMGYCYITSSGSFRISDQNNTGNKKAAKVHIDYMTA